MGNARINRNSLRLDVCMPFSVFVQSMEHCGCFLCTWLQAAGLVPVGITENVYIVAGCSTAIHAVSVAEAFCVLETLFYCLKGPNVAYSLCW
jgi:hypothetical protein